MRSKEEGGRLADSLPPYVSGRYTLVSAPCQALRCPCSSAWGALQAVWALACPLFTHIHTDVHTLRSPCVRRALILHAGDERQAAGFLSLSQRRRPDRNLLIFDPSPPHSSSPLELLNQVILFYLS